MRGIAHSPPHSLGVAVMPFEYMLAALKLIAERADQGGRRIETAMDTCDEIREIARAAIAKAEPKPEPPYEGDAHGGRFT